MRTTANFDPETYIRLIQLLLMGLEDLLTPDDLNEDARTGELYKKLQTYRDKVAKVKSIVAKHRDAERRKRELERDNDRRNGSEFRAKSVVDFWTIERRSAVGGGPTCLQRGTGIFPNFRINLPVSNYGGVSRHRHRQELHL